MFTAIGKLLVFAILTVSLLVLGWVAGGMIVQVNWYEKKAGDDGQPQGLFWRASDRLKPQTGGGVGLADRLRIMENRWKDADAAVRQAEAARPANLKWYDAQLAVLDQRDSPPALSDKPTVPEP